MKVDHESQLRTVKATADSALQKAMLRKTDNSQQAETMTREIQRLQVSNNDQSRKIQSLNEKAEETSRILNDKIQSLTKNLRDLKAENAELRAKLLHLAPTGRVPPLPKGSQTSSRSVSPVNDQLEQRVRMMAVSSYLSSYLGQLLLLHLLHRPS